MCKYLPQGVVPADDTAAVRTDTPLLWLVGDGIRRIRQRT